ncbi:MAG TPA: diacylglycerol kinase family protein [Vicinamibacterales bacterium]|jgi:YegS/Rv2252/BmrU family lipid kinase|nr:diacylglycerol kinase family protein [Vicinamibacterales bacterium]
MNSRPRIGVVINPVSGAGAHHDAGRSRAELARKVLTELGCVADVRVTERAGHARELARAMIDNGASRVIAWGGDGTINETGTTLLAAGVPLGIVPAGSGNGLATDLGLLTEPEEAFARAVRAEPKWIDAGEVNGRFFLNLVGIGFDALVARTFHELAAGRRGALPYVTIGLRAILTYRAQRYRLVLDGAPPLDTTALLVVFANARQYGSGAIIAPRARVDDGRLDAVIVDDRSLVKHLWRVRHLFRGTADRAEGAITQTVERALIESEAPMAIHADGEPIAPATHAEVRVIPGAIRVVY